MRLLILSLGFVCSIAGAETVFQCAVNQVNPDGVRLNVLESNKGARLNLIFGSTVSGTMYTVTKSRDGYLGTVKGHPEFEIQLMISQVIGRNSNISGYVSHLIAIYPDLNSSTGKGFVDLDLICGQKISDRWN
jgi:hypothetical protein